MGAMATDRVVTLLPSATEIVCALGCQDRLVGRSHECDYPPQVAGLPACTAANLDADGSSAEIDRRIGDLLSRALSVYRVDVDLLRSLDPHVVVTQDQCEACAVSLEDVESALAAWTGGRPRLVTLAAEGLEGLWRDIREVAGALRVAGRGRRVIDGLKARMADVASAAEALAVRPTVACIEWIEPLMAAGNWVPELVAMAGGRALIASPGRHSPRMSWEDLAAADPDIVMVMPCGFGRARTRAEMGPLTRQPGWDRLRAVRERRVYLTDGHHYFNRPGPRLADSLEILAEVLHPGRFAFGHQGEGWERF